MIAPSLHPEAIRAQAAPRGRFAFGLTQRTIWLLAVGLVLALPGFWPLNRSRRSGAERYLSAA
jgi:hypothetical protein